jgi:hypothetical protein
MSDRIDGGTQAHSNAPMSAITEDLHHPKGHCLQHLKKIVSYKSSNKRATSPFRTRNLMMPSAYDEFQPHRRWGA